MRAAVAQAITGAFAAQFSCDPLLDPALSRLMSVCASSIKRHGALLEAAIAEALVAGGLLVLRNVRAPFTRGALAFVASDDYSLARRHRLHFDANDVAGHVDIDILAIDDRAGWFAAHQVRRGGGATDSGRRRRSEREMRAAELVLGSWLRHKGYASINIGGVSVVDCLGQSGYASELVLEPSDLDGYYRLPIASAIAEMTSLTKRELERRLEILLSPVFDRYDARAMVDEAAVGLGVNGFHRTVFPADCHDGRVQPQASVRPPPRP